MERTIDFRILGPLEVWREGGSLPLGGLKQRSLLALLLLQANQVVSTDRLVHELWGDEPPGTAVTALHGYVSQLRKLIEPEREAGVQQGGAQCGVDAGEGALAGARGLLTSNFLICATGEVTDKRIVVLFVPQHAHMRTAKEEQ